MTENATNLGSAESALDRVYVNPVYGASFPDPYVLKYRGEYWAYCTGEWKDGRCFGILRSRDLVTWTEVGGAMEPLPGGQTCYWAPEVVYEGGLFSMYYSVGNHDFMHIRVATAEAAAGPFVDSGARLTSEDFAIDPHVFVDDDGTRYLFYATDFLEHTFIGTGTVRDRLLGPFELEGRPQPVTRAKFDWQVFDPARAEKGGVRWHTVEGPFVLKRKGRYYEMFSGGNWTNPSYGAAFATTETIRTEDEWSQACDGVSVPPVLRTIPGKVVGPGHNSVVRGPDNRQLFCVYHRWDDDCRVLAIDRLDWVGERLTVLGPSTTPQPAPNPPEVVGFGSGGGNAGFAPEWTVDGDRWSSRDGAAIQESTDGAASLGRAVSIPSFAVEVSVCLSGDGTESGSAGVAVSDREGRSLYLAVSRGEPRVSAKAGWLPDGGVIALSPVGHFDPTAFHLLRLEVDGRRASLCVDSAAVRWEGLLPSPAVSVEIRTEGTAATFDGFELTPGWEDLFDSADASPEAYGWTPGPEGDWVVDAGELRQRDEAIEQATITKGVPLGSYEFVVNARLDSRRAGASYGFLPAITHGGAGLRLGVEADGNGWVLVADDGSETRRLPLPQGFNPTVFQQFRLRKCGGALTVLGESDPVGVFQVPREKTYVGLYVAGGSAAFEMVRVTAIPESS
jgi:GH43 family beta-xylosidase